MRTPSWLQRTPDTHGRDLWWVRLILNVGRPVVAIFVLVMCAPGEHYLALQAGWNETLAWGMPGVLTAYAGIAAVVATKRAPGAHGKATAVWGAVVSILAAMAAQPIAHLYGRPGLTQQQIALIIVVSCIPALVFGHLLHMAAVRTETPDVTVVLRDTGTDRDMPGDVTTWQLADEDRAAVQADLMSLGQTADIESVGRRTPDTHWTPKPDKDTDIEPVFLINPRVRRTTDGSVPSLVRTLLSADPDTTDEDIRAAVLDKFPDTKADTLRKAITRNRPASRTA
jgi:hypothetical protein